MVQEYERGRDSVGCALYLKGRSVLTFDAKPF